MGIRKTTLWRGLTALFALLLSVSVFLTHLLFLYKGNVDTVLGTTPDVLETTEDTNYYPSLFGELSDANLAKLLEAEKEFNVQVQEEGSVLVKNNGALPLAANERSVTLFGRATADPVYRGGSGGAAFDTTDGISLYDALQSAGFTINDTLFQAYQDSSTKRVTAESTGASIGEEKIDFYTSALKNSYATDYNDVAIVMFSRISGEGNDMNVVDADGVPELSLHQQEADLLKMIQNSGKFQKTIVLINSGNAMDLDWVNDSQYGVDACLWIGLPGDYGFEGVANILTGKADATGRFVDTYATNSLSSPAMQNFGHHEYNNYSVQYQREYVVYAESIYVGYRYYETRYQDQVLGLHNASGTAGTFASAAGWTYAEEVAYPFGYGASYAEFSQELESLTWDRAAKTVTATVKVTNNGAPAGVNYTGTSKSVVQLYVQLPYTTGNAEKSAIQLIGFAKTGALAAGESESVTVTVDDYLFATYDENRINGADSSKQGCYVFDEGDYIFAVGDNAHDALNNVLSAKGAVGMTDETGAVVSGDAAKTQTVSLAQADNTTYATSPYTGEVVSNQFEDTNINYFNANAITYLTREDWNTFPKEYKLSVTEEMKTLLDANTYVKPDDAPAVSDFNVNRANNIKLVDMRDVAYEDDEAWDAFLDQLTVRELANHTADQLGSIEILNVGKPKSVSGDGPDGLQGSLKFGDKGPATQYAGAVLLTSTWNVELAALRGMYMAEDALYVGLSWNWGPGGDLHRTPYGGRNFEYYSEDGNLSALISEPQINAMTAGGLISGIKHFVLNDQEIDRHGVSTFLPEQALRENNLRAFEGALARGNALGVMSAFNRIGCTPTMQSYALLTQVLRNEWGFQGVCITDASQDGAGYMRTAEGIVAGSDVWCMDQTRASTFIKMVNTDGDGSILQALRRANKNFFYALSRSNLINGLTSETVLKSHLPWWQPAVIAIDAAFGVAMLGSLVMLILCAHVFSKREQSRR